MHPAFKVDCVGFQGPASRKPRIKGLLKFNTLLRQNIFLTS